MAAASMVLHTFCSAACPWVTFVRVHATFFFLRANTLVYVMCFHDDGFNKRLKAGYKKRPMFLLNNCS